MFEPPPRPISYTGPSSLAQTDTTLALPRGECRFILLHPQVTGQRCSCQGYALNSRVPDSSCECGHQACYHVPDTPSPSVPMGDHLRLAEMVRKLSNHLEKERADREKDMQSIYQAITGVYHNMNGFHDLTRTGLLDLEDRLDGAIDKAQGLYEDLRALKERVTCGDDASMNLELRVEELENELNDLAQGSNPERRGSPAAKGGIESVPVEEHTAPKINTYNSLDASWEAYVILGPGTPFDYRPGEIAELRLRSRGLYRFIVFAGQDHHSVKLGIDSAFFDVLQGRNWVPLSVQTMWPNGIVNVKVGCLSPDERESSRWDAPFLRHSCGFPPKTNQLPVIFVTLQDVVWTWESIRNLLPISGADQRCWSHSNALDVDFVRPRIPETVGRDLFKENPAFILKKQIKDFDRSPLDLLASLASMPMKRQLSELDKSIPDGSDGKMRKRPRALKPALDASKRKRVVSS